MCRDVANCLRPLGKGCRFAERLFAAAEVCEVKRGETGDFEHNLANAAPLAKLDSIAADSQRRLGSFVLPGAFREVAVDRSGLAALSPLGQEGDRSTHVVQALPVAEDNARISPEAVCASRLWQAEP